MSDTITASSFDALRVAFEGELYYTNSTEHEAQRILYATDASVYREKPLAVAIPKSITDVKNLLTFARNHRVTLIPRTAGTSLAGQVVGSGIVVDLSKYFTEILEINAEARWVRVQPGVIRDDLNKALAPYGLMFGPETSTANRAMIGGMVGNNSCGLHSMVWGSTRDHLLSAKVFLADGSEAEFKALSPWRYDLKREAEEHSLETSIYQGLHTLLSDPTNQQQIRDRFPKKSLTRRNTGYALDSLLENEPFTAGGADFNLCHLLAGSEGTLALATELKLNLIPLPPSEVAVVCVHCRSIQESLQANLVALKYQPMSSELVDKYILDFTKDNPEQSKNRFFIEGDPAAILMVEFMAETPQDLQQQVDQFVTSLRNQQIGFAAPVIFGEKTKQVWEVRKGGLGLIRNLPGDTQPVNLIEDCAVAPEELPHYIAELEEMLRRHNIHASYYAHAGAGELHVEPMINLKTSQGQQLFRQVLAETVELVKKYRGSLSGEHGDGRLRGEFIPQMMGQEVYALFREVKQLFDPHGVFNAGKIVDTPPMNQFLRYEADKPVRKINTYFDFSKQENILRLTEKCSGSGDCRKTELSGGTMCPSFMATRSEHDTTRARANILREFLTNSTQKNPFDHPEIKDVMDLCLSCKGCKSECPSSVDVAKLKAEFQQHYYDAHGVPFRSKMIGNFTRLSRMGSRMPRLYNWAMTSKFPSSILKKVMGFAPERSMPLIAQQTLRQWFAQHEFRLNSTGRVKFKRILFFCDEFTNYNDVEVGKKAILLLSGLGYKVEIPYHVESGRTYLSKGMVKEARKIAIKNVELLTEAIKDGPPIVGLEPSAILTLRDEYLELVPAELKEQAKLIAERAFIFDEFLAQEVDKKNIKSDQFTYEKRLIKLHGHCHQKALSSLTHTKKILSLPSQYEVHLIPSGCCGMAGSFGYEAKHYEVSMQIGELVLFPTVRKQPDDVTIAAPGTSCRHQIKDGTGRIAQHPAEILWEAFISNEYK
ncbi:FAD-binding and (Fe-S)-binding domain-containing protein [Siphonobacter sp. SORGH_AS_0500]|uniref:FAD-binding and (Fe-S)-binding domain-containing protein n=1 Tax=Siphonobacter sp. SORGH_AS_0500 TaxID=1864824 RepID=UPI000CA6D1E2|nr:FAD-binding and (Fe-S)-binding domain-containing protein [Siphonobacter sp. SORGH_AS_0500]MDR6196573.1 FAD/FMN-containing dehydrogenase/Fe-S oxidoreductase [Siphonobacter sp. SORGH_AS_0500]PKK35805.1 FAD-binding oxidoreductase [Siphonobacter sp. SORGH_AS_0500]